MFVDTSAVVAIFAGEPEAKSYRDTIIADQASFTSPLVVLEAVMVLSSRLDAEPTVVLERLLGFFTETGVTIASIEAEHAVLAVEAFATYGKGRQHPAQLNLADCLSYACAKRAGLPMLYKGNDFALTDAKLSG